MPLMKKNRFRVIVSTICKSIRQALNKHGVLVTDVSDGKIRGLIKRALTLRIDENVSISGAILKYQDYPDLSTRFDFKVKIIIDGVSENDLCRYVKGISFHRKKYLEAQLTELFEKIPRFQTMKCLSISIDLWPLKDVLLDSDDKVKKKRERSKKKKSKSLKSGIVLMEDKMRWVLMSDNHKAQEH